MSSYPALVLIAIREGVRAGALEDTVLPHALIASTVGVAKGSEKWREGGRQKETTRLRLK
jgi:hypothetical protein